MQFRMESPQLLANLGNRNFSVRQTNAWFYWDCGNRKSFRRCRSINVAATAAVQEQSTVANYGEP